MGSLYKSHTFMYREDSSMNIVRLKNTHPDFIGLTKRLDAELNARYGRQQAIYDKHNIIDPIDTAIVGYLDEIPVTCGCFKVIDGQTVEIKRMYVASDHRRKGLAVLTLQALEKWAAALGFKRAILETGKGQPEAIGLYEKCGYGVTANYGPYVGMDNSRCMAKSLGGVGGGGALGSEHPMVPKNARWPMCG
jgi:putative acetyltransferase